MFKRKRNIPNENIQQHGNNEIKEEETDMSSNLQQNQPNLKKRDPGKRKIEHGDDSSSPIEPIKGESIEMKQRIKQLEEELSKQQKHKIELEKLKQSYKKLEEEK
ncbi:hypothetical protein RhiirC2_753263, partial [Rhizophagus irregularis]